MARRSLHSSHQVQEDGCRHSGYYSAVGLYLRDSRKLRYVFVCDDCGEEMREIATLDYTPKPVLAGT
jgi:hypothetical protein